MSTDKVQKKPVVTHIYYEPISAECEEDFYCLNDIKIREVKSVKPVSSLPSIFSGIDMVELVQFKYNEH